jgi:hypothetical protein
MLYSVNTGAMTSIVAGTSVILVSSLVHSVDHRSNGETVCVQPDEVHLAQLVLGVGKALRYFLHGKVGGIYFPF